MHALAFVLVLTVARLVHGDATFNSSAAALCASPGCDFSDPRIWMYQVRPSTFGNVFISWTSFSNQITVTVSEVYALGNLTLYGAVKLSVTQNLQVSNLMVSADAMLAISAQGAVKSIGEATFISAQLEVQDSGRYTHDGDPLLANSFLLDQLSTLTVIDLAWISLYSPTLPQIFGSVTFGPSTTFMGNAYFQASPSITNIAFPNTPFLDTISFSGLSVTFEKGLTCKTILTDKSSLTIFGNTVVQSLNISQNSNVYVRNANAQLDNISGKGLLFIQTSTIKFSGNGEPLSQLILAGTVNATASNIVFGPITFSNGQLNDPPSVSFVINNYVQFAGTNNIPGSISTSNAQLFFNGATTLSGSISIISSTVTINGVFKTSADIYLQQLNPDAAPSYLNINGSLSAPSVVIENGCSLRSTGNGSSVSIISGDVINNGSILVSPSFPLQITGSYTQLPNTTFIVFLDPETSSESALEVGETANLAGEIYYDVTTNSSSKGVAFSIISATDINGTFDAPPASASDLVVEAKITYSTNEVILVMFKDLETAPLLKWWMILMIFVGSIAACLVASHFIILAMRHHHYHKFEPL